jgi:hypothetical protein
VGLHSRAATLIDFTVLQSEYPYLAIRTFLYRYAEFLRLRNVSETVRWPNAIMPDLDSELM